MKFVLVILLFLNFFSYILHAARIKIDNSGNGGAFNKSCYILKEISTNKDGYIDLGFILSTDIVWNGTSYVNKIRKNCNNNPIDSVKTVPEKTLRKIYKIDLISKKVTDDYFYLTVLPSTTTVIIDGVNHNGLSETKYYHVKDAIKKLKDIEKNNNWTINLSNSEEKLVEKKNSDKTPPQIKLFNLENNQITDSYNFFIRGNVSDEVGVLTVLVNNKKSNVKADGTFAARVKLGYGINKIKIQAEDVNGNVSEKTISIIREEFISETSLSDVDIPIKTNMKNNEGLAVVIGVENYQYVPDATYAYNDAEVFREYVSSTLGYNKQRIKLATNSKATQAELNKLLGSNGWLARNVVKDASDIVVYFSGHGIANQKENTSGLLPYDVDPNYSTGILLNKIYKDLGSMGARSVTIFLDACFTGQTRSEEMLIADSRPITIVPIEKDVPSNITVLSATSSSEVSSALKEKEHGLFTYYLLKGMAGKADENKDNSLDIKELSNYVIKEVKEQAALSGREQTPQIIGDNSKLLIQY